MATTRPIGGPAVPALLLAVIGLFSIWVMHPVALNGDELSYSSGGQTLGLWVRSLFGDTGAQGSVLDGVLQRGWFMPGMSFVLGPVYALVGADAPFWLLRVYVLVINLVLLWLIAEQLRHRWGRTAELVFLGALAISPYYMLFLSTAWADVLSLHLGILVLFWIYDRFLVDREGPSAATGVTAGLLVAALTYLRPVYPVYLVFLAVTAVLWALRRKVNGERLRRAGVSVVIAAVVAIALLLPWTLVVSDRFGFGLPTTARQISSIAWRGDPSVITEAQEATGSGDVFVALYEFVWDRAEDQSVTFREAATALERQSEVDRSLPETLGLYRSNALRFFAIEHEAANVFVHRFVTLRCQGEVQCIESGWSGALEGWATWSWRVLLALGAILFLLPHRMRSADDVFMSFLWKASVFSLAVWPLLRYTHGRYYVGLIPLIALGLAIAAANRPRSIQLSDFDSGPRGWFVVNVLGQALSALFVLALVALMA